MAAYQVIGQPVPRTDGPEKVSGGALYTADVALPGTLWGKTLHSPHPHALIVRIDTARAAQLPGVHAVLTGADVVGMRYGYRIKDTPLLAHDRVRFAGERVAAVAAIDHDIAQRALELIEVEYEDLPAVFEPLEALAEGAPLLHPDMNSYVGLPEPLEKPSNAFVHQVWRSGDVVEGFARSDVIVEHTYTTPMIHQAYLEPNSCLVRIDEKRRVQVWASSKAPYGLKRNLAAAVGIPEEHIVLNHVHIGGDFGAKGLTLDAPICFLLAQRTGRPVKIVMDFVEEFTAANPRHATVMRLKTGVKRDGTLVAHQSEVFFNSGAYGSRMPGGFLHGGGRAGGPYRIPHVLMESRQVYTNMVHCGYMRAPGEPQVFFAIESHMDSIARQLGMDPLEFRMKNLIDDGESLSDGKLFQGVRAKETLQSAVKAGGYRKSKATHIGRGIAMGLRAPTGGEAHARVSLHPDGSVLLQTPIFDQGAGSYSMMRQIVAEELGLPVERVNIEIWNTDGVSFDTGQSGSRVTRIEGIAVYRAVQKVRHEMLRLAAELLRCPVEGLSLSGEDILRVDTGEPYPWRELVARTGQAVAGEHHVQDTSQPPVTSFTAQVVEVAVDPETGEVQLLNVTTAHDVGTIMNPLSHQGQIEGALMQGVGFALMEQVGVGEGRVTTLSFGDYKIPSVKDIPRLQTVLLEPNQGVGPYNIKGIGENSLGPVAPAIANAVEDAVGVRVRDLPVTAEKVYRQLHGDGG